ncbi:Receptor-type tyrosine-protein phosphatase epsilon, partial [Fragariocoptes setiger]
SIFKPSRHSRISNKIQTLVYNHTYHGYKNSSEIKCKFLLLSLCLAVSLASAVSIDNGASDTALIVTPNAPAMRVPENSSAQLRCLIDASSLTPSSSDVLLSGPVIGLTIGEYKLNATETTTPQTISSAVSVHWFRAKEPVPIEFDWGQHIRDPQSESSLVESVVQQQEFGNEQVRQLGDSLFESIVTLVRARSTNNGSYYCVAQTLNAGTVSAARIDLLILSPPIVHLERVEVDRSPATQQLRAYIVWRLVSDGNAPLSRLMLMLRNETSLILDSPDIDSSNSASGWQRIDLALNDGTITQNSLDNMRRQLVAFQHSGGSSKRESQEVEFVAGAMYAFKLGASNDAGQSEWTAPIEARMPSTVPGPVRQVLLLSATNETLAIGWRRPNHVDISAPITRYEMQLETSSKVGEPIVVSLLAIPNQHQQPASQHPTASQQRQATNYMYFFANLSPGTDYRFQVSACSHLGCGPPSTPPLLASTLDSLPEAPTQVTIECRLVLVSRNRIQPPETATVEPRSSSQESSPEVSLFGDVSSAVDAQSGVNSAPNIEQDVVENRVVVRWRSPRLLNARVVAYNVTIDAFTRYPHADNGARHVDDAWQLAFVVNANNVSSVSNIHQTLDQENKWEASALLQPNTNYSVRVCAMNRQQQCSRFSHLSALTQCSTPPTLPANVPEFHLLPVNTSDDQSPTADGTKNVDSLTTVSGSFIGRNSSTRMLSLLRLKLAPISQRNGPIRCVQIVVIKLALNSTAAELLNHNQSLFERVLPRHASQVQLTSYFGSTTLDVPSSFADTTSKIPTQSNGHQIAREYHAYIAEELVWWRAWHPPDATNVTLGDEIFSRCSPDAYHSNGDSSLALSAVTQETGIERPGQQAQKRQVLDTLIHKRASSTLIDNLSDDEVAEMKRLQASSEFVFDGRLTPGALYSGFARVIVNESLVKYSRYFAPTFAPLPFGDESQTSSEASNSRDTNSALRSLNQSPTNDVSTRSGLDASVTVTHMSQALTSGARALLARMRDTLPHLDAAFEAAQHASPFLLMGVTSVVFVLISLLIMLLFVGLQRLPVCRNHSKHVAPIDNNEVARPLVNKHTTDNFVCSSSPNRGGDSTDTGQILDDNSKNKPSEYRSTEANLDCEQQVSTAQGSQSQDLNYNESYAPPLSNDIAEVAGVIAPIGHCQAHRRIESEDTSNDLIPSYESGSKTLGRKVKKTSTAPSTPANGIGQLSTNQHRTLDRRNSHSRRTREQALTLSAVDMSIVFLAKRFNRALPVRALCPVYAHRCASGLIEAEFAQLPVHEPNSARFRRTLVRVADGDSCVSAADFISAHLVTGFGAQCHTPGNQPATLGIAKRYVCSTSPSAAPNSIWYFWRLIVEHGVRWVVALAGSEPDAQYWPTCDSEEMSINPPASSSDQRLIRLTQRTLEAPPGGDYVVRELCLTFLEANQHQKLMSQPLIQVMVTQFECRAWPTFKVYARSLRLIEFVERVNSAIASEHTSSVDPELFTPTVLVHCSNGVGRTGVFVTLDLLLADLAQQQLDQQQQQCSERKFKINVFDLVSCLRNQRPLLVNTLNNYKLIYTTMCEYYTFGDTTFHVSDIARLRAHYELLTNSARECDRMALEFARLSQLDGHISPPPGGATVYVANMLCNAALNRCSTIVPFDYNRVLLPDNGTDHNHTHNTNGTDANIIPDGHRTTRYINASYVQEFGAVPKHKLTTSGGWPVDTTNQLQLIVAQSPIPEVTESDFCLMLYSSRVALIISLDSIDQATASHPSCARHGDTPSASNNERTICACPTRAYWPRGGISGETERIIGDRWRLTLLAEPERVGVTCVERHLLLTDMSKQTSNGLRIRHLHCHTWPLSSNAGSTTTRPVLELLELSGLNKLEEPIRGSQHIVVHDKTGAKCGVLIALAFLARQMAREQRLDLVQTCRLVRSQRPKLISSPAQYVLVYRCLLDYVSTSLSHTATQQVPAPHEHQIRLCNTCTCCSYSTPAAIGHSKLQSLKH